MAGKLTAKEVVTQQHVRSFIQLGGAMPTNKPAYYGRESQYMAITGLSHPERGDISPINVPDPARRKAYRLIGTTEDAPDLPGYTLTMWQKHGAVPRALGVIGCPFNAYLSVGVCKDPSDFDRGWEDYLHILSGGIVTDKDHGDQTPMDSDNNLSTDLTVVLADEYAVGPLGFGPEASVQVQTEVIDVAFAPPNACAGCVTGKEWQYAVVINKGASPAAPAQVIYSVDGGATPATLAITGIGATAVPTAIRVVGSYLVVLVKAENAYYFTPINDLTGVPSSTWTKVIAGFVATFTPNDMYVAGPSEVYFAAAGGYIYKSTDITAGVNVINAANATSSNLARIHGIDSTIVAVGAAGTILLSQNRGATFATTTSNGGITADATAVWVLDDSRFWIGTNAGEVWYTLTKGESWTQKVISTFVAIQDISFPTDECGYIAATATGPSAKLYATCNGGFSWNSSRARLQNVPTANRFNRIAFPYSDSQTAVNNVLIGGLAGDGVDGVMLFGTAPTL